MVINKSTYKRTCLKLKQNYGDSTLWWSSLLELELLFLVSILLERAILSSLSLTRYRGLKSGCAGHSLKYLFHKYLLLLRISTLFWVETCPCRSFSFLSRLWTLQEQQMCVLSSLGSIGQKFTRSTSSTWLHTWAVLYSSSHLYGVSKTSPSW